MSIEAFEVYTVAGQAPLLVLVAFEGNDENYTEGFIVLPSVAQGENGFEGFAMTTSTKLPPATAREVAIARLTKLIWDRNSAEVAATQPVDFLPASKERVAALRSVMLYPSLDKLSRKTHLPVVAQFLSETRGHYLVDVGFH